MPRWLQATAHIGVAFQDISVLCLDVWHVGDPGRNVSLQIVHQITQLCERVPTPTVLKCF